MKVRKILTVSFLLILFSSSNIVFGKKGKDYRNKKYSNEVCKDLYHGVLRTLAVAGKSWKEQKWKKADLETQTAKNYSTVYATFCKDK